MAEVCSQPVPALAKLGFRVLFLSNANENEWRANDHSCGDVAPVAVVWLADV